jgi:hypothetical protein
MVKPVVSADREGRVVVVAMNMAADGMTSGLIRWRSTDRGRTWGEPALFESIPAGCDFLADPWLATDHRGRFHLVQVATSLKAPRASPPCVYRRSLDGGATWPHAVEIADGLDRPVLAVSPNGQRVAVLGMGGDAAAGRAAPLTAEELKNPALATAALNRVMTTRVFRSDDRGKSWKPLPGPPGVRHAVPFGTVIDDAGRIAAGWLVNDGAGSRSVVGTTADQGASWAVTVLAESVQPDRPHPFSGGRFPVVALDGAGRLQVVFVGARGKAVSARVSPDWTTWSAPVRLSSEQASEVRFPAVAGTGDVVHAVWMERSGDRYRMRHRGSKDGGASWSEPLTLSRANAGPSLVTEDGFFITGDDDQPAIADDAAGTAHAVWAVRGRPGEGWAVWSAAVEWQVPNP